MGKLTLSFLLLAVAFLHASALPFDVEKLRGQIMDKVAGKVSDNAVLGQAIAKAQGYLNKHKPNGDVKAWLEGAIDQARDHIENAKELTQAQKDKALEKGRQFFENLVNKMKAIISAGGPKEMIQAKAAELAKKNAEEEAKRLAEEAVKKAEEEAKRGLGKLFG